MIVVGIGCRRDTAAGDIEAIVRESLAAEGLAVSDLAGLATETLKAKELGVRAAAQTFGLPLMPFDRAALALFADRVLTRSARVAAVMGIPSIAEAAALAGAGRGARLRGPRRANTRATCAIAEGEGP